MKTILNNILEELNLIFTDLNEEELEELKKYILKANKIFVAGAGRSLMMIRAFVMRLMHLGFTAYVVGETVTPVIEKGDLLIIASGFGQTGTLTVMAQKCKSMDIDLALITTNPKSSIASLANCVVNVKTSTTKLENNKSISKQPGANAFEQSVLLIGDAIIIDLLNGKKIDETNADLMKKHANLE